MNTEHTPLNNAHKNWAKNIYKKSQNSWDLHLNFKGENKFS